MTADIPQTPDECVKHPNRGRGGIDAIGRSGRDRTTSTVFDWSAKQTIAGQLAENLPALQRTRLPALFSLLQAVALSCTL